MYRKRKGFTLSEVIIYLAITSLILAIPTSFMIIKDRGYELKVEGEISKDVYKRQSRETFRVYRKV